MTMSTDNGDADDVLRAGVREVAHPLPVVEEKDQEDQGGRQQRHGDDLDEQGDEHEGRAGNENDDARGAQEQHVHRVEPWRLPDLVVQGVGPAEHLPECP